MHLTREVPNLMRKNKLEQMERHTMILDRKPQYHKEVSSEVTDKYKATPKFLNYIYFSRARQVENKAYLALVGVVQWTEYQLLNQRVAGSISSKGTCLGCRLGLQLGKCERQRTEVSLTH